MCLGVRGGCSTFTSDVGIRIVGETGSRDLGTILVSDTGSGNVGGKGAFLSVSEEKV